jgi:uncharacterized protein YndB with AHSA1/START domain
MKADLAMICVETSVVINQPHEKAFAFVTKPENDEKWYVGLKSWDRTPDEPPGVGSTSQSRIRFLGIPFEVTRKVDEYDPPHKIGIKTIEGVSVEADYAFEAVAEGKTKVTVHGQADLEGVLDLAEPVVERIGQRQWANSLENLKDVLEA